MGWRCCREEQLGSRLFLCVHFSKRIRWLVIVEGSYAYFGRLNSLFFQNLTLLSVDLEGGIIYEQTLLLKRWCSKIISQRLAILKWNQFGLLQSFWGLFEQTEAWIHTLVLILGGWTELAWICRCQFISTFCGKTTLSKHILVGWFETLPKIFAQITYRGLHFVLLSDNRLIVFVFRKLHRLRLKNRLVGYHLLTNLTLVVMRNAISTSQRTISDIITLIVPIYHIF